MKTSGVRVRTVDKEEVHPKRYSDELTGRLYRLPKGVSFTRFYLTQFDYDRKDTGSESSMYPREDGVRHRIFIQVGCNFSRPFLIRGEKLPSSQSLTDMYNFGVCKEKVSRI